MNPHNIIPFPCTKIVIAAKKLTIPKRVSTIMTAKEKNAMNALAWMSGCLF